MKITITSDYIDSIDGIAVIAGTELTISQLFEHLALGHDPYELEREYDVETATIYKLLKDVSESCKIS